MTPKGPPLGELLDALAVDGFKIGVDDHVRIGRLIALEASWDEDALRIAVRALLAKDLEQRATFDAVWARLFAPAPHAEQKPEPPVPTPVEVQVRRSRRIVLAASVCLVLVAGAIWWLRSSRDGGHHVALDAGVVVARPSLDDGGTIDSAIHAPTEAAGSDHRAPETAAPKPRSDSAVDRPTPRPRS